MAVQTTLPLKGADLLRTDPSFQQACRGLALRPMRCAIPRRDNLRQRRGESARRINWRLRSCSACVFPSSRRASKASHLSRPSRSSSPISACCSASSLSPRAICRSVSARSCNSASRSMLQHTMSRAARRGMEERVGRPERSLSKAGTLKQGREKEVTLGIIAPAVRPEPRADSFCSARLFSGSAQSCLRRHPRVSRNRRLLRCDAARFRSAHRPSAIWLIREDYSLGGRHSAAQRRLDRGRRCPSRGCTPLPRSQ